MTELEMITAENNNLKANLNEEHALRVGFGKALLRMEDEKKELESKIAELQSKEYERRQSIVSLQSSIEYACKLLIQAGQRDEAFKILRHENLLLTRYYRNMTTGEVVKVIGLKKCESPADVKTWECYPPDPTIGQ